MLSHAAARAFVRRAAPASLRVARSYAKDSRPPNARRTPLREQKDRNSEPTRYGGFGGATAAGKKSAQNGQQDAMQDFHSTATGEMNENATPTRNTAPQSQSHSSDQTWEKGDAIKFASSGPGAAATTSTAQAARKRSSETSKQDAGSRETAEFDRDATPTRNTEPSSQPGPDTARTRSTQQESRVEFSEEQDKFSNSRQPEVNTAPSQPLPDLRQGIPSTFDVEFMKKVESEREGERDLDITESKESEDPASAEGAGRGGDREYPSSAYESSVDRRRDNFAYYLYLIIATIGVAGTVYFGRNWANEEEERVHSDAPSGWSFVLMWKRIKARLGGQVSYYTEPAFEKLLPDMDPSIRPPMTLVLSLEDLLIHSEWTRENGWRMAKRPGVDYFVRYLSQYYELAIFTTVPSQSGIPVVQKLDPFHVIMWPLFREATRYENGEYIKVHSLQYTN